MSLIYTEALKSRLNWRTHLGQIQSEGFPIVYTLGYYQKGSHLCHSFTEEKWNMLQVSTDQLLFYDLTLTEAVNGVRSLLRGDLRGTGRA